MAKLLLSLKNWPRPFGMSAASHPVRMTSVPQICPISTRPAFFGTRRIAPVAATSRSEAWGARPAVEELRPARPNTQTTPRIYVPESVRPKGPYVAHIISHMTPREPVDPRLAAQSYAAADALNYADLSLAVASL
jgi:hypothetical protein